jgi:hypothetical protein
MPEKIINMVGQASKFGFERFQKTQNQNKWPWTLTYVNGVNCKVVEDDKMNPTVLKNRL